MAIPPRTFDPAHMVTPERAERVARELFPDDYHDGSDCRKEVGRIGLPCTACASLRETWLHRVEQVRLAMIKSFR